MQDWTHLEKGNFEQVISDIPFACGGRVLIPTRTKKVLTKHEKGIIPRVAKTVTEIAVAKKEESRQRTRMHDNIHTASDVRLLHAEAVKNWSSVTDIRISHARATKQRFIDEKAVASMESLEFKLSWEQRRHEAAALREAQARQRVFLKAVVSVASFEWMQNCIQEAREEQLLEARRKWAASTIQKWIRPILLTSMHVRYGDAMIVLRQLKRCVRAWKVRRVHHKAEVVKNFLFGLSKNAAIQINMRRFRGKIVRCQRAIRDFLACCRGRVDMLDLQWKRADFDRVKKFNDITAAKTAVLRHSMTTKLAATGKKLELAKACAEKVAKLSGQKGVRLLEQTLSQSRDRFLERHLPENVREVNQISANVKGVMLQSLAKRMRFQRARERSDFKALYKSWQEKQETQKDLQQVAELMMAAQEQDPSSHTSVETPLIVAMRGLLLQRVPPGAPPIRLLLSAQAMQQMLAKAVDLSHNAHGAEADTPSLLRPLEHVALPFVLEDDLLGSPEGGTRA